jgi:hypothetical protein
MGVFDNLITTELLDIYTSGEDEMYRGLAIPCLLAFAPVRTECPNCIISPINRSSSGKYKSGGPYPFTIGVCPYCHGAGYKEMTNTRTLSMQVGWKVKDFLDIFKTMAVLEAPESYVQIKAPLSELSNILNTTSISINTPWQPVANYNFKRKSEPIPSGIRQNKYFYMLLERI